MPVWRPCARPRICPFGQYACLAQGLDGAGAWTRLVEIEGLGLVARGLRGRCKSSQGGFAGHAANLQEIDGQGTALGQECIGGEDGLSRTGRTGHTETVRVTFDPAKVSYADLLKVFFENHDPTQGMRQGNDVGTQFGGSLFAMCDPWWMLGALRCLGEDYIVWDKAANIEFVSPGRGAVYADFSISQQLLDEIRMRTADGSKYLPRMHVEVRDGDGTLVARVQKTLYIRLKPRARQAGDN